MRARWIIGWLCGVLPLLGMAQDGKGGGVYLETGASVVGALVQGNRGMEGYGVYGGGTVENCTVMENESAENPMTGIRPGWVYVEGDSAVSLEAWVEKHNGGVDLQPLGVVFWVNSDVYSPLHGYAVALDEEAMTWGSSTLVTTADGFEFAVEDTASYGNTDRLARGVSQPANYCINYGTGGPMAGRWVLPAAYYLSALFTAREAVNTSLAGIGQALTALQPTMRFLTDDYYWSSSESDQDQMWCVDFGKLDYPDKEGTTYGACVLALKEVLPGWSWDTWQAVVRPVFAF